MSEPGTGYTYLVSEEQIREHQKHSAAAILEWLHQANMFLKKVQTVKEKEIMNQFRTGESGNK